MCTDMMRLSDEFTYCSDDGSRTSWIDHVLCSKLLDDKITECCEEYLDLCTKIAALFSESEAAYLYVTGDFNCEYNTLGNTL